MYDRLDLDPAEAATAMGLALPAQAVAGAGLTVAGVTASPAREAALRAAYAPLTEAMEGFGAALAAATAGLPFVELRSVSNRVGARPPDGWDLPGAFAALGLRRGMTVRAMWDAAWDQGRGWVDMGAALAQVHGKGGKLRKASRDHQYRR